MTWLSRMFGVMSLSLAALAAACGAPAGSEGLDDETALYALVTTADGFFFYPPLGPEPVYSGTFDDAELAGLTVLLEGLDPSGRLAYKAEFDQSSDLRLVHKHPMYLLNVPAAAHFLDSSLSYRFRVILDGRELGRSDLGPQVFTAIAKNPYFLVGVKFRLELRPAPVLTSITPSHALAGAAKVALTLGGSGFSSDSVVHFAGHALPATKVSDAELVVDVTSDLFPTVGTYDVSVSTPAPGGGTSATLTFTAENGVPVLTALSSTGVMAGSPSLVLTLTGSAFASDASALFNGTAISTSFVSSGELVATIPAALLAAGGSAHVAVENPAPGGGQSNALGFDVSNAVPSATALDPATAPASGATLAMTVTGSAFVPGAVVSLGGTALATSFVSSTQLVATVPASSLVMTGSLAVTVANPAPTSGESAALTFTVTAAGLSLSSLSPDNVAAGSATLALKLYGTGFVVGSRAWFGTTGLSTTYVSSTQLNAIVPRTLLATRGVFNLTVTNPAPNAATSTPVPFTVR